MFGKLTGWFGTHKSGILWAVLAVIVLAAGAWWYMGFTLDFSRFFAAAPGPEVVINSSLPLKHGDVLDVSWSANTAVSCNATNWIDTGGANEGRATSNAVNACAASGGSFTITCCYTDGTCGSTSKNFAIDQSTCPTAATPTPTATAGGGGGGGGICAGAAQKHTDSVSGVTVCTLSTTFDSGRCSSGKSGTITQVVGVDNTNVYGESGYIRSSGFHDPADGCGATQTAPFGFSPSGPGSVPSGGSGTYTFSYNIDSLSCGRVQLDACFHTDGHGCSDNDHWNILGKVISSGKGNCIVATPTPTPTPTVTPTPTPSQRPTPTSSPGALSCSPSQQSALVDQSVSFTSSGGQTTSPFYWTAPGGNPPSFTDPLNSYSFTTVYSAAGSYTVTVTKEGLSATCTVTISGGATPTPTPTATPTPTPTVTPTPTPTLVTQPHMTLSKMVRNVSQNTPSGYTESVGASPGDTVEFSIRVLSDGQSPVVNVVLSDVLPAGLSYIAGSTRIDTQQASDGITGSGNGIGLGTLNPGRTITVLFRAQVTGESFFSVGTTTLTNISRLRADNLAELVDPAFVQVSKAFTTPNLSVTLVKLGRNISRNETAEQSSVTTSPAQTLEFIIRVRNTSNAPLTNVVLRDIMPNGVVPIAGTTTIDGSSVPDTLATTGLPLGTLQPGEGRTILTRVRMVNANAIPTGTTTVINTAQVSADGLPVLIAQLPIVILNPGITTVVTTPTGPGQVTVLALIISAIVTLLYVGYSGSDAFRRREVSSIAQQEAKERDTFDFKE